MNIKITIHIYPRLSKSNSAGLPPIYFRITINGRRKEFSTKKFINPSRWDHKMMRVKGNSEEARTINSYLDLLKNKVHQVENTLQFQNTPVTSEEVINYLIGKRKDRERMLLEIFKEHNKKVKALIGVDFALGTFSRYETSAKHISDYLQFQYHIKDIPITKVDHAFITGFDYYLRTERKCCNNTTVKYIKNFKKIIRICLANNWISKDPFLNYKVKLTSVEREILNDIEIQKIINKEISIERLDIVRDIFIFSCYTGLAYIDVKQLTKENIVRGIDGHLWIHTHRQKTAVPTKIPLLEMARRIIEKYEQHPISSNNEALLPVFTNQRINAYLKEIATICNINKELTFHCARHTFATTITLSNGVPIETVSKMLGHKSIKTTQHYAKITDRKVANDMEILKNVLGNNKQNGSNKFKNG